MHAQLASTRLGQVEPTKIQETLGSVQVDTCTYIGELEAKLISIRERLCGMSEQKNSDPQAIPQGVISLQFEMRSRLMRLNGLAEEILKNL